MERDRGILCIHFLRVEERADDVDGGLRRARSLVGFLLLDERIVRLYKALDAVLEPSHDEDYAQDVVEGLARVFDLPVCIDVGEPERVQRVAHVREVRGGVAGPEGLWREVPNGPVWTLSVSEVGLRLGVGEVLLQRMFRSDHRGDGCFVLFHH